jgi:hypothetical protein
LLTCREVTERINEFVDGELGFFAALEVRFHLLICKYCRGFVNQMRTVVNLVHERGDVPPSGEAEEELLVALRKQSNGTPKY